MGIMDIFKKENREAKNLEKHSRRVVNRNAQHEDRMASMEALAELANSGESSALLAILRRFEMTLEKAPEEEAEKQFVREIIREFDEEGVIAIRTFMKESEAVTWPIELLRTMRSDEAVTEAILDTLELEISRDTVKPNKKLRLMEHLSGNTDPRVVEILIPALMDFDETVRLRAAEVLFSVGDERAREPLLEMMIDEDSDSERIRNTVIRGFVKTGWLVTGYRPQVEALLDEHHHVNRTGHIRRVGE